MPLPIVENFRRRWGIGNPVTPIKTSPKPLPKMPAASMKTPQTPVKTFGAEKAPHSLPISQERSRKIRRESLAELAKYEEEIAPIKSHNQETRQEFRGVGLSDPKIALSVAIWEREQKALFSPFITGEIQSTSPIRTYQN